MAKSKKGGSSAAPAPNSWTQLLVAIAVSFGLGLACGVVSYEGGYVFVIVILLTVTNIVYSHISYKAAAVAKDAAEAAQEAAEAAQAAAEALAP